MIDNPDDAAAVQFYFENGGVVHRIPYGVSGLHPCLVGSRDNRLLTFIAWAQRFGYDVLPNEAIDFLLSGRLTMVQVRAPLVWRTIAQSDIGMTLAAIATALRCSEIGTRRALELLECRDLAFVYRRDRFIHYRALGLVAPTWRTLMSAPIFRQGQPAPLTTSCLAG